MSLFKKCFIKTQSYNAECRMAKPIRKNKIY